MAAVRDVVVVGDGPAGTALAQACTTRGIDTVLIGPDADWGATYATWVDDLDDLTAGPDALPVADLLATTIEAIAVHTDRSRMLERTYGVFDNDSLRSRLRAGVDHRRGRVDRLDSARSDRCVVRLEDGVELSARLVVDAAGWPARLAPRRPGGDPAWQTALGVVLAEPPAGELATPTWMDFRPVVRAVGDADGRRSTVGPRDVTTFCYSLPVRDGWLVEETVLAARPAVEPVALLPRLAARLGRHPDDVLAAARRTEYVRIPMGGAVPGRGPRTVAFGAAAGYVHPATGFSVAASLRAAPRVATAIAEALGTVADVDRVADAVWPAPMRRTRSLHDFGLAALLRLDDDEVRQFFGTFFDLPVDRWAAYLRIDAPPGEVAGAMSALFRSSPWSLRRRLMAGNPAGLGRLVRP